MLHFKAVIIALSSELQIATIIKLAIFIHRVENFIPNRTYHGPEPRQGRQELRVGMRSRRKGDIACKGSSTLHS